MSENTEREEEKPKQQESQEESQEISSSNPEKGKERDLEDPNQFEWNFNQLITILRTNKKRELTDSVQEEPLYLESLGVSPFIYTKIPTEDLPKLLNIFPTIKHLGSITIRPLTGYEALNSSQVVSLCEELSSSETIRSLTINAQLNLDSLAILSDFIESSKLKLDTLNLPYHKLGPKAAPHILKVIKCGGILPSEDKKDIPLDEKISVSKTEKPLESVQLHRLDLLGNDLGEKSVQELAQVLQNSPYIKTLLIGQNQMGVEGAKSISRLLCENEVIKNIDVSYMDAVPSPEISLSDAVVPIAEALKVNLTLTQLDLSHTNLGVRGWESLIEALNVNKTLRTLNVEDCFAGPKMGAQFCSSLKDNLSLTWLNLSMNGLQNEGAIALVESLKYNSALEYLNICYNNIGEVVFRDLLEVLSHRNRTLNALNFEKGKKNVPDSSLDNNCSPETAEALRSRLRSNTLPDMAFLGIERPFVPQQQQRDPSLKVLPFPKSDNYLNTPPPQRGQGRQGNRGGYNGNELAPQEDGFRIGKRNVSNWREYFEVCGIPEEFSQMYEALFLANHVTLEQLPDLNLEFLRAIGVTLVGHQMRILKYRF